MIIIPIITDHGTAVLEVLPSAIVAFRHPKNHFDSTWFLVGGEWFETKKSISEIKKLMQ